MEHTKEQLASWILSEWSEDYYHFDDVVADFEIQDMKREGNSIHVQCSFLGDETKKGVEDEHLVLFEYDPENHSGFFPSEFQLITFQIVYTWSTAEECDALTSDYESNFCDIDVVSVAWDDSELRDEIVEQLLDQQDEIAIAETLINLHNAKEVMPEFVPNRLRPYFEKIIQKF